MLELTNTEKLAIAQAFQKAVGDMTKTGDPTNLRGRVDAEMKERYLGDPMAGRSYDVKLLGKKVGTYSITVSKGKPSKTVNALNVLDQQEFTEWAICNGFMTVDMSAVLAYFNESGEVPEGCEPIQLVEPGTEGGEITRTTLKIEPESVARVLGPQLEPIAYALLEGGTDE